MGAEIKPRFLGHMALHSRPGENGMAAELFDAIGCIAVDAGPVRGGREFHVVKVNSTEPQGRDDIIFLSTMTDEQAALEDALKGVLKQDLEGQFAAFLDQKNINPEFFFHFAVHYDSLEDLEAATARVQAAIDAATPMGRRIQRLQVLKAQAGKDPAIDARMAASPVFSEVTEEAYSPGGVQVHIHTDLFGSGLSLFGSVLELDYVFPGSRD